MNFQRLSHLQYNGKLLLDIGMQPVTNRFVEQDRLETVPKFPLRLRQCQETGLVHLEQPFPAEELKPRYEWLTCYEPEDHLDELADMLLTLPGIDLNCVFGGYSFKDDSTLHRILQRGVKKTWRIDPVSDLNIADPCANVETYQTVFGPDIARNIGRKKGLVDVLLVRHVLEHAFDLPKFFDGLRKMVKPGGYIVIEVPDCERSLAAGDCTSIWEEHVFYFTRFTFICLLQSAGFAIVDFESISYPMENSLIAIVQEAERSQMASQFDDRNLALEIDRAEAFVVTIARRRQIVREKLIDFWSKNRLVAIFGAGHLSIAFLSILDIHDLIDLAIDDNANKKGLCLPVGNIKIIGSESLYNQNIALCLLGLNPHNQPKVMNHHFGFLEKGGQFASIFPGTSHYLEDVL